MSDRPTAGERWLVKHRLPDAHEVVTVEAVTPGKYNIDKGATAPYPDDDVQFVFAYSGRRSRCGMTAFLRTYVHEAEVLDRAG